MNRIAALACAVMLLAVPAAAQTGPGKSPSAPGQTGNTPGQMQQNNPGTTGKDFAPGQKMLDEPGKPGGQGGASQYAPGQQQGTNPTRGK